MSEYTEPLALCVTAATLLLRLIQLEPWWSGLMVKLRRRITRRSRSPSHRP